MNTDTQTTVTRRLMLAAPAAALALPAAASAQNSTDAAWAIWSDAHPRMRACCEAWETAIQRYFDQGGTMRLDVFPFIKSGDRNFFIAEEVEDAGMPNCEALLRQLEEHNAEWNAEHERTGIAAIQREWDRQADLAGRSAEAIRTAPTNTATDAARKIRVELTTMIDADPSQLEPLVAVIDFLGGTE